MDYVYKSIAGALVALLIALLTKSKYIYVVGLIPLFPTFALFAHVLVFHEKGIEAVKEVAVFGLLSLIPYALYLLAVLWLVDYMKFTPTILIGILTWIVSAAFIVYLWEKLQIF